MQIETFGTQIFSRYRAERRLLVGVGPMGASFFYRHNRIDSISLGRRDMHQRTGKKRRRTMYDMTLYNMPAELLVNVLSVSEARDVEALGSTCTTMRTLARDPVLWKYLFERDYGPFTNAVSVSNHGPTATVPPIHGPNSRSLPMPISEN